ncbi:tubulin polyglutamylase TTLL11 isoform X3 [Paroedura picta]|uniref:tubulin polyglutamylase TTLL11 isoform X3 n=1 Tax=Paroedura picta TaxID=143630 RepID=UPI0040565D0A
MEPPPGTAAAEAPPEAAERAAQPASAPPAGLGAAPHGKTRGAGGRRGGAKAQARHRRPVTVDSSKARTSLDALKISLRQLRWREIQTRQGSSINVHLKSFPFGRRLPCDIYWHGVSFHDNDIFSGQVNKFPGMTEMVRKITLSRAVRIMQDLFPEEYNFYPRSWILPEEFTNFLTEIRLMKDNNPSWKPTFIVKPDGGCQGDGIYLIKEPSEVRLMGNLQSRPAVVQEYISKPLLIDKLKFDIRLYVLLKSLEPLEVYVAKDGLSRFCTEPYQEPTLKNLHHVFMHLTNYSLNIHSGKFVHSDSSNTGSKRTFSSILYRLSSKGVDIKKVWSDIIALVIKTVIAMIPELKVHYQSDIPAGKPGPSCFQILGFDILLMKNLKPVLLEVNANPSMRIEHEKELSPGVFECVPSPVDEEVKVAVIRDTLRLVDPHKKRKEDKLSQPAEPASQENKDFPEEESMDKLELEPSKPPESNLPTVCLKQVFPKYSKQFNYLRLVERIAVLFIRFLGVRGTTKLGPTGFRTFVRNCKVSNSSFSMAAADILYIDISRKWQSLGVDQRESDFSANQMQFTAVCRGKYNPQMPCAFQTEHG